MGRKNKQIFVKVMIMGLLNIDKKMMKMNVININVNQEVKESTIITVNRDYLQQQIKGNLKNKQDQDFTMQINLQLDQKGNTISQQQRVKGIFNIIHKICWLNQSIEKVNPILSTYQRKQKIRPTQPKTMHSQTKLNIHLNQNTIAKTIILSSKNYTPIPQNSIQTHYNPIQAPSHLQHTSSQAQQLNNIQTEQNSMQQQSQQKCMQTSQKLLSSSQEGVKLEQEDTKQYKQEHNQDIITNQFQQVQSFNQLKRGVGQLNGDSLNGGNTKLFQNIKLSISTPNNELQITGVEDHIKQSQTIVNATLQQNALGANSNKSLKSKQPLRTNQSITSDQLSNKKRLSFSQKTLNFSPTNIKKPKSTHLNLGANFSSNRSGLIGINYLQSSQEQNNKQQNMVDQNIQQLKIPLTLIQYGEEDQSQEFQNNLDRASQNSYGNHSGIVQQQQFTFQHTKNIFSPIKQFFKSQNSLDFSQSHFQLNKKCQPQSLTNSSHIHQTFSSTQQQQHQSLQSQQQYQHLQQPQQVMSAKNKYSKGPFYFPTTKISSLAQLYNNNNNNNNIKSNVNLSNHKGSISEFSQNFNSVSHQNQNQNQLFSGNGGSIQQKGQNNNNIVKMEREQLVEKIKKLEEQSQGMTSLMIMQGEIKDMAIQQLKGMIELQQDVNSLDADNFNNILQLDEQYENQFKRIRQQLEFQRHDESLTIMPKFQLKSPKGKTMTDLHKIYGDQQSNKYENSLNLRQRNSQPNLSLNNQNLLNSPKRKIHFEKIIHKDITIGQVDKMSPNKKRLIMNETNKNMKRLINNQMNTDNHYSNGNTNISGQSGNNVTEQNFNNAAQQGTNSTQNTILYTNQKQSLDHNIRNTSSITELIQPVIFNQDNLLALQLERIKERMLHALKMKVLCHICSRECPQIPCNNDNEKNGSKQISNDLSNPKKIQLTDQNQKYN